MTAHKEVKDYVVLPPIMRRKPWRGGELNLVLIKLLDALDPWHNYASAF